MQPSLPGRGALQEGGASPGPPATRLNRPTGEHVPLGSTSSKRPSPNSYFGPLVQGRERTLDLSQADRRSSFYCCCHGQVTSPGFLPRKIINSCPAHFTELVCNLKGLCTFPWDYQPAFPKVSSAEHQSGVLRIKRSLMSSRTSKDWEKLCSPHSCIILPERHL